MLFCSCFSRSCSLGREMFVLPSLTSSNPRGRSFTITHDSERAIFQISNWTFCFVQVCNVTVVCTLPRGGMCWEIHPLRSQSFPEGGDFASRGLRYCLRANFYHCQCYLREEVCLIFGQGSVSKILSLVQYFPIHSLGSRKCIGKYDPCRSCHSISSQLPVNTKKYIPILQ